MSSLDDSLKVRRLVIGVRLRFFEMAPRGITVVAVSSLLVTLGIFIRERLNAMNTAENV